MMGLMTSRSPGARWGGAMQRRRHRRVEAAWRRSGSVPASSRGGAYRSPRDARFGNRWGVDHGGAGMMCSAAGLAREE
jgi:hypothetical protein